jgi:hypothetical protein
MMTFHSEQNDPSTEYKPTPLNTLYYKYWMPWVNELYSSDARIVTAYFRLTASEIATFEVLR